MKKYDVRIVDKHFFVKNHRGVEYFLVSDHTFFIDEVEHNVNDYVEITITVKEEK